MRRNHLLSLLGSCALAACGSGSIGTVPSEANYQACVAGVPKPPGAEGSTDVAPVSVNVTPGLLSVDTTSIDSALRESTAVQMRSALAQSRYSAVIHARCDDLRPKRSSDYAASDDAAGRGAPSAASSSGGPEASQVSTTNNQVVGVDEADFVKNDTRDIIVANGSSARILRSWPAADTREISRVTVEGTVKRLFLTNDRLVVFSSVARSAAESSQGSSSSSGSSGYSGSAGPSTSSSDSGCAYGYDCQNFGDGMGTLISVFDVTNRERPTFLRSLRTSNSLIAARRIGNVVHLVTVTNRFNSSSYFSTYPGSLGNKPSETAVNSAYDALLATNEQRIKTLSISDSFPKMVESNGTEHVASLYQSSLDDGGDFTTLSSFDIVDETLFKAVTVISKAGTVYASAGSIYMSVTHNQGGYGWYEGYRGKNELSTIHKFAIGTSPFDTDYVATGVVEGRVLNQFSMDEYEGNLRIATTTGHLPSLDAHNTLTVLGQKERALETLGKVEKIAPTEDIRSVRFDGDRGYMVTFKKTDPLYVFDLKTATAPKILGELKIPGFSTYMHRLDANHLLTIGYDAGDHGSFAYFSGVLLQIFDVTDPTTPRLAHKLRIGTRGSSSEALANHLAFNYFGAKGVLAIPMTICEGGGDGSYGTNMTFSGLQVYNVSVAGGIQLRGQVAHPSPGAIGSSYYNNAACSQWWSNASSEVKRSVIMDDFVYSVSDTRMKVNSLNALSTDIKEIKF